MATPEEIKELKGEIRKLNGEIDDLESERRSAKTDELKISLGAHITAIRNQITAKEQRLLFLEQQGKFHHIFLLFLPNLLDVILCPNLFRHLLFTNSGSAVPRGRMRNNWILLWFADTDDVFLVLSYLYLNYYDSKFHRGFGKHNQANC